MSLLIQMMKEASNNKEKSKYKNQKKAKRKVSKTMMNKNKIKWMKNSKI